MAQIMTVNLVDDFDGSEATETVSFGLDGKFYEIDLSEQNAEGLRKSLADYIPRARKVSGRQQRRTTTNQSPARGGENQAIRDWAEANGFDVRPKGRIPRAVLDAYKAR